MLVDETRANRAACLEQVRANGGLFHPEFPSDVRWRQTAHIGELEDESLLFGQRVEVREREASQGDGVGIDGGCDSVARVGVARPRGQQALRLRSVLRRSDRATLRVTANSQVEKRLAPSK